MDNSPEDRSNSPLFWTAVPDVVTIRSMGMQDYTTDCGWLPHLECASLEDAVGHLVSELVSAGEVDNAASLVEEVMRRERADSTAIGDGIVLPHARSSGVRAVRLAVATLARPLDVSAADGRPVDVVILLVGPDGDPRRMLQVLARLARLVKQTDFLTRLRGATDAAGLQDIFASV